MEKRTYSLDDNDYLRSYLSDSETTDLKNAAKFLGTSTQNVNTHINYMRKHDYREHWAYLKRPYTKKEDTLVKEKYGYWTYAEIGKALNRSVQSVYQRVKFLKLGLKSKSLSDYDQQIRELAKKDYTKHK